MKKSITKQGNGFFKKIFILPAICVIMHLCLFEQVNAQTCRLSITRTVVHPICNGACNGSITDVVGGGSGQYGYLWNTGQTTNAISQLCAGVYTVTVTDLVTQCTKVRTSTLKKGKVGASFTRTPAHCGLCNGTITAIGHGGNGGPFTYHWSTGATTATLTNACPNVYYGITVTDKLGCTYVCRQKVTNVGTTQSDNNVCTIDACDPATGQTIYTPVDTDDDNECTTDGCDPVTGVFHDPITTPPTINCPGDAVISGGTFPGGPCVDLGGGGVAIVTNPNPTGQPSQVGIDFHQPRNQNHPTDPLDWTDGVNNITQAEYFEGMGVPQRLILTDLAPGSHTLRFRHEAVKHQADDRHAYDFLMSWDQAIATAIDIGNGSLNELEDLNSQKCLEGISNDGATACTSFTTSDSAVIPDAMGNPPNHHGISNVNDVIACFEAAYGERKIFIEGNGAITAFNITFDGYEGSATGDNYAWYTISWTSASTNVMIKLAGRAAMGGAGACGYGACYGAGSVSGAPYHFKLELLDGASTGNRDNQVMVEEPEPCDLDKPVSFGDATSPNGDVSVVTSDSVSVGINSVTHCRRWVATNDCNISSECTQCIQVVCVAARLEGGENTEGAQLSIYPNPTKSLVNFDLVFDRDVDNVSLEIVNLTGQKVAEIYRGNIAEGTQKHFEFDASKLTEGVYFYHLNAESLSRTGKVVIIK